MFKNPTKNKLPIKMHRVTLFLFVSAHVHCEWPTVVAVVKDDQEEPAIQAIQLDKETSEYFVDT